MKGNFKIEAVGEDKKTQMDVFCEWEQKTDDNDKTA